MALLDGTATELLAELNAGRVSSAELTRACLERIERLDGRIESFLTVDSEGALRTAADVDARRAAGSPVGRLGGLPIALKDILCTQGQRTTCGSKMLAEFLPPYDATVVAKIRQADGVVLGKLNLDEFAMGGSTENSAFRRTRNPWDLSRTPGGSSGGSAACVAAGLAPLSVGTDTGGSIRQPAAFCGVTGLKPTYGRVSRYGLVAFASSLDQAGPIGRSAADAALLLQTMAGHDPRDATSAPAPVPDYLAELDRPLEGLRIGVIREHLEGVEGLDGAVESAVREALREFERAGAKLVDVSLPHSRYGIATYYVIAPCEASSNLARYDGVHYGYRADERAMAAELAEERAAIEARNDSAARRELDSPLVRLYRRSRSEGFGPEVKRRIMLGAYALSAGYYDAYYLKALRVRRLIRNDYDSAFREVDLLVGPTTPRAAFPLGSMVENPLAMYLEDLYTVAANLAGVAGISIPCGRTPDGLPIGLQLQAPPLAESRLLNAAHRFQLSTDWHQARPPLD